MAWFNRKEKGINTPTEDKKETPDGLWYKCPECKNVMPTREHKHNSYTCASCSHHERIGAQEYFEMLFDNCQFTELNANLKSADPLGFYDSKPYPQRIKEAQEKVDFWNELSLSEQKEIEKGIAALNKGKRVEFNDFLKKIS
jgi:acetyl-CoA carboxylase carboxyl transferase subunit beta